ncbi:fungal-specific transcription factor domain-containing protein [Pterulicium gracile]|uniref:Fungal-specific transcription factor domain-containing protein n=1 Tax=Pterulicium gracile TaxID=1884261 RepID=A0A5C3Q4C3_9AGAR|nr:fungal-specific transcription factor domain-containing protein [Pterula gracilis]
MLLVQEVLGLQPHPDPQNPSIPHVSFATSAIADGWVPVGSLVQQVPLYEFPEDDLMRSLIDLYFEHYHLFLPLLHQPSFEDQVANKLHHRDTGFACVLLLVCAHALRYSHDLRVLSPQTHLLQSGGWKCFNQAHATPQHILDPVTLYEPQFNLLSADFLRCSSIPSTGWTVLAAAIRKAQDIGAHRKDTFKHKLRVQQELWKRMWWGLAVVERTASAANGRSCVTGPAEIDVDLPTECEDEYWDHPDPALNWKRPEGVPASVAFYNCLIRLTGILDHAMSLLLNHWVDSIPKHLKWDARPTKPTWKRQSLTLPSLTFDFHSLAICTNAARACVHLIDLSDRDEDCNAIGYEMQWSLFTATVVLVLNVWSGRKAGIPLSFSEDLRDVWKSLQFYQRLEERLVTYTIIRMDRWGEYISSVNEIQMLNTLDQLNFGAD